MKREVCTNCGGVLVAESLGWRCKNCRGFISLQDGKFYEYVEKPFMPQQTNADRIRGMSDEELADWLARTQIDNIAEALKIACIPWEQHPDLRELTAKDNLEWLKQPV